MSNSPSDISPGLTDADLRSRRRARMLSLAVVTVGWLGLGLLWWRDPWAVVFLAQGVLMSVAPLGIGVHQGWSARTPVRRRSWYRPVRPFWWCVAALLILRIAVDLVWAYGPTGYHIVPRPPLASVIGHSIWQLLGRGVVMWLLHQLGYFGGEGWRRRSRRRDHPLAPGAWAKPVGPGADLSRANWTARELGGIDLTGAGLQWAVLDGADLRQANLSQASLAEASALGTCLAGACLHGTDLRGVDLRQADLSEADLTVADLRAADLTDVTLEGARLEDAVYDAETRWPIGFDPEDHGATFRSGPLAEVVPFGTDLMDTDLRSAKLRGADLQNADLENADLRGADLRRACLFRADLRNANLQNANLRDTDLRGADLQSANLTAAGLDGAVYNDETRWPEGFDPEDHGAEQVG